MAYGTEDIKRLRGDEGIVRNKNKILAAIHNDCEFERIAGEHGGFQEWLDSIDKSNNYEAVVKRLQPTFKHVGQSTASIFLYSIGRDIKHEE